MCCYDISNDASVASSQNIISTCSTHNILIFTKNCWSAILECEFRTLALFSRCDTDQLQIIHPDYYSPGQCIHCFFFLFFCLFEIQSGDTHMYTMCVCVYNTRSVKIVVDPSRIYWRYPRMVQFSFHRHTNVCLFTYSVAIQFGMRPTVHHINTSIL